MSDTLAHIERHGFTIHNWRIGVEDHNLDYLIFRDMNPLAGGAAFNSGTDKSYIMSPNTRRYL